MTEIKRTDSGSDASPIRRGISRRTVARGMAWTAPVVLTSVTVPAFAASPAPCTNPTILLGTFVKTFNDDLDRDEVTSIKFGTGTSAFSATVSYETIGWDGNPKPGDTSEVHRTEFHNGDDNTPNYDYITLQHPDESGYSKDDTIVATIDFTPKTVRNLTFSITDIDFITGRWIDHVFVTPKATVLARGSTVIGDGTYKDPTVAGSVDKPFKSNESGDRLSSRGDVTLTWPGYVSKIKVTYVAADEDNASDDGQHIGLGKFSVSSC